MHRGGDVLAPGPPERKVQFIDVRDLGEWLVHLAEERIPGAFNAVRPAEPFGELRAAPHGPGLEQVEQAQHTGRGAGGGAVGRWERSLLTVEYPCDLCSFSPSSA